MISLDIVDVLLEQLNGLPFRGSVYKVQINKLKLTINLLLKFIFFKPKYHSSIYTVNDYCVFKSDTL